MMYIRLVTPTIRMVRVVTTMRRISKTKDNDDKGVILIVVVVLRKVIDWSEWKEKKIILY